MLSSIPQAGGNIYRASISSEGEGERGDPVQVQAGETRLWLKLCRDLCCFDGCGGIGSLLRYTDEVQS